MSGNLHPVSLHTPVMLTVTYLALPSLCAAVHSDQHIPCSAAVCADNYSALRASYRADK
jgi:hypothetical protein